MYLESRQGETGFPNQRMLGTMGNAASDFVTMMGTDAGTPAQAAASAASAAPPAVAPAPMRQMAPDGDRASMVAMGAAAFLVLGLGFVIYKATRD